MSELVRRSRLKVLLFRGILSAAYVPDDYTGISVETRTAPQP
jgi:hypothetical protein